MLEQTHSFLGYCFSQKAARLSKISDSDIGKIVSKHHGPAVIEEEIKSKIPPHRSSDHKIDLIPENYKIPRARTRPCSPVELQVIKRWLDDQLGKGWIRPSTSPAASPLLIAKKPGGGIRIGHEFRGINSRTLQNRYPLPFIKEPLDLVCNAKIFTKVDVISAFNRIRIKGQEWLTTFTTRFGLHEQLCQVGSW
ncbi:hypothetical protein K3495_g1103 [Podosphaera aphanis]|nr:hypothetical protein K3495_g1103 [Podosphaera aphanis]